VGDDVAAERVVENAAAIKGLTDVAAGVLKVADSHADGAVSSGSTLHLASAIEFVLEALHVNDKLSKYAFRERTFYKR
jgi:hypothetical protein